jgi:primosomal protein N' (replication factor Y)
MCFIVHQTNVNNLLISDCKSIKKYFYTKKLLIFVVEKMRKMFVKVALPLYFGFDGTPVYSVPDGMSGIQTGIRVVVPLGSRKLYSGIVTEICDSAPAEFAVRDIIGIIDDAPITTAPQLALWRWLADYYLCTPGEVLKAALPAGMKLESETVVSLNPCDDDALPASDSIEYAIIRTLADKPLSMDELARRVNRKNIMPQIKRLLDDGLLDLAENLASSVHFRYHNFVVLHPSISDSARLSARLDALKRSPSQEKLLLKYAELAAPIDYSAPCEIARDTLLSQSGATLSSYRMCERKEIFVTVKRRADQIVADDVVSKQLPTLSPAQQQAFDEICRTDRPVLLHGVTSSGKTEIYIRLISATLNDNRQALYLLPEIALTTQIVERLRKVFGSRVIVYHSGLSEAERTAAYNRLLRLRNSDDSACVVLGARSATLLPFDALGLIVVDEEHEPSYKQSEPAPRYNARDAAVVLASLHRARIVLGSATPSLESFYNATHGKYALVRLTERYGDAVLPDIRTIDMRRAYDSKNVVANFSRPLIDSIRAALDRHEQVILFQNRRGFSPFVQCNDCGYVARCANCDVSLTYHKTAATLNCHYCGYSTPMPHRCPSCGNTGIRSKGFGTEKLENELSLLVPEARVERLDLDATKSRYAYERILRNFESHTTDILIGTQMITKGLDFANVGLVGVMNADNLLNFPDFRADERSFQLMSQVAGRAGRKNTRGEVVVQTFVPGNTVIRRVVKHDYDGFYETKIAERRAFGYPPFTRLLILSLRHTKLEVVRDACNSIKPALTTLFADSVAGPETPLIARVKNRFILDFRIKLPKDAQMSARKRQLSQILSQLKSNRRYSGLQVIADVDPL